MVEGAERLAKNDATSGPTPRSSAGVTSTRMNNASKMSSVTLNDKKPTLALTSAPLTLSCPDSNGYSAKLIPTSSGLAEVFHVTDPSKPLDAGAPNWDRSDLAGKMQRHRDR